jgi:hypothetical protein
MPTLLLRSLLQRSGSSGSSGLQRRARRANLDSSGSSGPQRKWASPCQGEGRGFESRRPLHEGADQLMKRDLQEILLLANGVPRLARLRHAVLWAS